MQVALYVHPFDIAALGAHGGLGRLRDLGISELAIATSYHDGRWLTPWHPERRVRFLEDGTVHFRPRSGETYGALQPVVSSEVPAAAGEPSPLEQLCAEAPRAGLAVRAWTVFGHNTRLGLQHPEATVENAFGDRYPYALCPAHPEVQRYHEALVRDLAAHDGLGTIELEALGQMGIQHSSHHDKKSFTPAGLLAFALSACFGEASMRVYAQLGHDGEAVRRQVVDYVRAQVTDADAMSPASQPAHAGELSDEQRLWVDAVLAVRAQTVRDLAARVVAASGDCRRAVQVHPDPWFTGSQLSLHSATAFPAGDERVLTCYGEGPDRIAAALASDEVQALAVTPKRVCIWPKAPQFTCDEDLIKLRGLARDQRVGSVAIYHLGLLPWRTLERVARILAA